MESSEVEDTGVKKVDIQRDQNTEVQNTGDTDERAVPELNGSQTEENGTTPDNDGEDYILDDQDIDPAMQDDQMSRASQDDNYHTAIDDDDPDDTVQFGNPVTQPFLSRSVRVPTKEVGCLSFTQMFQDYFQEYSSPSQADAFLQIQEMAQTLDMYLKRYLAQYINCMTSDSEFVDVDAENHTQVPYHTHFNDVLTEYPAWSTNTNDIAKTNEAQYRENRQDILKAWQKDVSEKTPDNRQVLDDIEVYTQDR